jgi:hypothetical protein
LAKTYKKTNKIRALANKFVFSQSGPIKGNLIGGRRTTKIANKKIEPIRLREIDVNIVEKIL